MDADVVIDADETPCAVLQASRTVDMHPSPRIAGRGCQRRIRGDGARAREWRECRQRREQEVVRLHASRSPLIRLSATFSPPSGEKESRYASRTVYVHPSPRIAGRGCQRRVRGDGARAREWRGCRQRREQEVGAAACTALAPHPAPNQVRGRLFGHFLPAAQGEGLYRERAIRREEGTAPAILDGDALAAKLDEARASHNGTHVVAVAVHLDPAGRCCGADHACSVPQCSQRSRQRVRAHAGELRAGSQAGMNMRCLAC